MSPPRVHPHDDIKLAALSSALVNAATLALALVVVGHPWTTEGPALDQAWECVLLGAVLVTIGGLVWAAFKGSVEVAGVAILITAAFLGAEFVATFVLIACVLLSSSD